MEEKGEGEVNRPKKAFTYDSDNNNLRDAASVEIFFVKLEKNEQI